MPDSILTFDSWWYFYHRIQEGSFAQWDPYSLLGKIAVQWNHIPVSIFFPFLVFSGVTLSTFHACTIIGTFLAYLSIYLAGRILKFDRYYTLIPVILYAFRSEYKYYTTFPYMSTLLFFFPLAFAFLLYDLYYKNQLSFSRWLLFVILSSLAFTGARLEHIVYCSSFIFLMFFVFGIYQAKNVKKMLFIFIWGILGILVIFLANAWQLSYLMNVTLDNFRVSPGISLQKLFDSFFWRWVFYSIAHQPSLILLFINIWFLQILYFISKIKLKRKLFENYKRLNNNTILHKLFFICITLLLLAGQLLLYKFFVQNLPEAELINNYLRTTFKDKEIIFSMLGYVTLIVGIFLFVLNTNKPNIKTSLLLLTAIFSGIFVAEHSFYIPRYFKQLIVFGMINLTKKEKYWVITLMVLFTLVGTTGVFFLEEIFGIPWITFRSGLFTVPIFILLIIESMNFIVDETVFFIKKFAKINTISSLQLKVNYGVKFVCLVFVFLILKTFFLPISYDEAGIAFFNPGAFFQKTEVKKCNFNNKGRLEEAYENTTEFKSKYQNYDKIHTKRVGWDGPFKQGEFMNRNSQLLNTILIYSTEIPKNLYNIIKKHQPIPIPIHVEIDNVYKAYSFFDKYGKKIEDKKKIREIIHSNYRRFVVINFKGYNSPVYKEILASENSSTPRVFLTRKVVKLKNDIEENDYLENILSKGGLLTDQITTSDKNFVETIYESNKTFSFQYDINFVKDDPEHIELNVYSNENSYLSLMDLYSKGWKAFVNGEEVPIYKGYIGTRFIQIPRGMLNVEFKYKLPGLIPASIISIITWIIMLALVIMNFRFSFHADKSKSEETEDYSIFRLVANLLFVLLFINEYFIYCNDFFK